MPSPASSSPGELIIGTYTERLPHVDGQAEGILSCRYEDGTIGPVRVLAPTRNPSFLVVSPDGGRLYAVNETVEFEGQPGGGVTAFARDPRTGDLSLLNTRPSGGVEPAHLELNPSGRFLLVANYRSGSVAVFELGPDGSIGPMTDHVQHQGSSVHPIRQSGPHAHMIMFDPGNGNVLVPDLGVDAILCYELSDEGKLVERPRQRIETAAGAGPGTSPSIRAAHTCCSSTSSTTHSSRCAARGTASCPPTPPRRCRRGSRVTARPRRSGSRLPVAPRSYPTGGPTATRSPCSASTRTRARSAPPGSPRRRDVSRASSFSRPTAAS